MNTKFSVGFRTVILVALVLTILVSAFFLAGPLNRNHRARTSSIYPYLIASETTPVVLVGELLSVKLLKHQAYRI